MSIAKNILSINRGRITRLWINAESRKGRPAEWTEMGHFYSGFELKIARIVETDGRKRDRPCAFQAQGTFEAAQNTIGDLQNHLFLMNGVRGVAILIGDQRFDDIGKLLIFDWNGDDDQRISILANTPYYAGNILKTNGSISGFIQGFRQYRVTNLAFVNGQLSYRKAESLFLEGTPQINYGNATP